MFRPRHDGGGRPARPYLGGGTFNSNLITTRTFRPVAECQCASCRRTLLPVLNKRWAGLLGPGPAWEEVDIIGANRVSDVTEADAAAMLTWFSHRSGSVKDLWLFGSASKLPASLISAVLMSQIALLRVLALNAGAVTWVSSADLAVLAVLTGLKDLTPNLPKGPGAAGWDDKSAAVVRILSRLPALESMKFEEVQSTPEAVRPTVSQLASLQGPKLALLDWSLTSIPEGILAIGALPSLASCTLRWRSIRHVDAEDDVLHVTPASFSGTLGISKLALSDVGQLQLAPHCFRGLSMLADLTLSNLRYVN